MQKKLSELDRQVDALKVEAEMKAMKYPGARPFRAVRN
jgi:hypothetical protein